MEKPSHGGLIAASHIKAKTNFLQTSQKTYTKAST
jgi:hypothetical protein